MTGPRSIHLTFSAAVAAAVLGIGSAALAILLVLQLVGTPTYSNKVWTTKWRSIWSDYRLQSWRHGWPLLYAERSSTFHGALLEAGPWGFLGEEIVWYPTALALDFGLCAAVAVVVVIGWKIWLRQVLRSYPSTNHRARECAFGTDQA